MKNRMIEKATKKRMKSKLCVGSKYWTGCPVWRINYYSGIRNVVSLLLTKSDEESHGELAVE
jgi:hypothetical protein